MSDTQVDEAERNEEDLPKMSFGDHLDELRRRLFRSLIAVAVCVFTMLPFKKEVTEVYLQPYRIMWDQAFITHCANLEDVVTAGGGLDNLHKLRREAVEFCREYKDSILDRSYPLELSQQIQIKAGFKPSYDLVATGGLEDIWTFMAAALLFALMIAAPYVIYQMWAFVGAGLYKHERRVVTRYMPFGVGLLTGGVGFGYFVVVPTALYFLVQLMESSGTIYLPSVSQYFSLLLTLTAALGFVFQLPLFMLALTKVGLVSHAAWRANWRYVILGFFLTSAMLTPPDPFTQIMMAGPMIVLYIVGLMVTKRANPGLAAYNTGDSGNADDAS